VVLSGIICDIATHGWAGSQKDPGQPVYLVHANPKRRLAKFDERREAARANIEGRSRRQRLSEPRHRRPDGGPVIGELIGASRRIACFDLLGLVLAGEGNSLARGQL